MSALSQILHQNNGQYGLATICNGGGGGSALIIEKFSLQIKYFPYMKLARLLRSQIVLVLED